MAAAPGLAVSRLAVCCTLVSDRSGAPAALPLTQVVSPPSSHAAAAATVAPTAAAGAGRAGRGVGCAAAAPAAALASIDARSSCLPAASCWNTASDRRSASAAACPFACTTCMAVDAMAIRQGPADACRSAASGAASK